MLNRSLRFVGLSLILVLVLLVTAACSVGSSSDDQGLSTRSGTSETASLPSGLNTLLGVAPTPTAIVPSATVSAQDINLAQDTANKIAAGVTNSYSDIHVVVTAARVVENSGSLVVGYVVMFAVPEYLFDPQTLSQEQQAETFQPRAGEALVSLLKETMVNVVPNVAAVKALEIIVLYPDTSGIDFIVSTDALSTLPQDAAKASWLSMLSATSLVFAPAQTQQQGQAK